MLPPIMTAAADIMTTKNAVSMTTITNMTTAAADMTTAVMIPMSPQDVFPAGHPSAKEPDTTAPWDAHHSHLSADS